MNEIITERERRAARAIMRYVNKIDLIIRLIKDSNTLSPDEAKSLDLALGSNVAIGDIFSTDFRKDQMPLAFALANNAKNGIKDVSPHYYFASLTSDLRELFCCIETMIGLIDSDIAVKFRMKIILDDILSCLSSPCDFGLPEGSDALESALNLVKTMLEVLGSAFYNKAIADTFFELFCILIASAQSEIALADKRMAEEAIKAGKRMSRPKKALINLITSLEEVKDEACSLSVYLSAK